MLRSTATRTLWLALVPILILLFVAVIAVEGSSTKSKQRRAVREAVKAESWIEGAAQAIEGDGSNESSRDVVLWTERITDIDDQLGVPGLNNNLREALNVTYMQCVHHSQRWLKVNMSRAKGYLEGDFLDTDGNVTSNPVKGPIREWCGNRNRNCSATKNPCGLHYIPHEDIFSGIDQVIFVGDSTMLRNYKFIQRASGPAYKQKVAALKSAHIETTLTLSSGRVVKMHLFRLLYASLMQYVLNDIFKIATSNTAIFITLGPHDTSWLIFDRATFYMTHVMPGLSLVPQKHGGKKVKPTAAVLMNLRRAKIYWEKWITVGANALGEHLRDFEMKKREELLAKAPDEKARRLIRSQDTSYLRPFVVFREHLLPRCNDPKYAMRPMTRCPNLLKPLIVPFMRSYLRSQFALINVPVVGMDSLTAKPGLPCYLMDAGHLPRVCKSIELQLLVHAVRTGRRLKIRQGFPIGASSFYGSPPSVQNALEHVSAGYSQVANMVTLLRPQGVVHPNQLVREAGETYQFESFVFPTQFSLPELQLFNYFDNSSAVEHQMDVGGIDVLVSKMEDEDTSQRPDFEAENITTTVQNASDANVVDADGRTSDVKQQGAQAVSTPLPSDDSAECASPRVGGSAASSGALSVGLLLLLSSMVIFLWRQVSA